MTILTTKTEPTTETHRQAHELALSYAAFSTGIRTDNDFDMWFWGEVLIKAQAAIGFEMMTSSLVASIARDARARLDRAEGIETIESSLKRLPDIRDR